MDTNAQRNCDECGAPIPAERLKAEPSTHLCVACKTELAKKAKVPHVREQSESLSAERERKAKATIKGVATRRRNWEKRNKL